MSDFDLKINYNVSLSNIKLTPCQTLGQMLTKCQVWNQIIFEQSDFELLMSCFVFWEEILEVFWVQEPVLNIEFRFLNLKTELGFPNSNLNSDF